MGWPRVPAAAAIAAFDRPASSKTRHEQHGVEGATTAGRMVEAGHAGSMGASLAVSQSRSGAAAALECLEVQRTHVGLHFQQLS